MADIQGYIIVFIIYLVSLILVRVILAKTRRKACLPPSPVALPIIGHLHLLGSLPHQAFHKLSKQYGPLIHIYLGSVPCVVASSSELAKEFLKTHETSFSNRPKIAAIDYLTYGSVNLSFTPYGPYWKFLKKLCMSELLGGRTLDQLLPVRRDEIKRLILKLQRKAESGEKVDVRSELVSVSNNIISRMSMSKRCSGDEGEAEEVRRMIQENSELGGKFNLSDFFGICKNLDLQGFGKKLKEARGKFDRIMDGIIMEHEEERRKMKGGGGDGTTLKDLLHILLDISEDENAEMKLTKENIKAFILDVFGAGSDTSAMTIEWALSELINQPQVMKKAIQEMDSVVGTNRLVEESDITSLPYLQAIVKETLRLHPAGPLILRQSTETCTISGYDIPANTRLFVNVWAIGRDPKHWEKPLEFRPERFVNEDGSSKRQMDVRGQHFDLLPFGSGRRSCPGTSLALLVVQTGIAALIQCFEWTVEGNGTVSMDEGVGLTLPRAHPLLCVPVERLNPFPSM